LATTPARKPIRMVQRIDMKGLDASWVAAARGAACRDS
jgi:hypothetical protein